MRTLSTLALAGLFGGFLLVGDASACHKKKACACPAPAPVCAPAPAPVACAPTKTKHHMKMPKMGCHKKAAPVCATGYAAPMGYSAPVSYPSSQSYPTAQATGQGM